MLVNAENDIDVPDVQIAELFLQEQKKDTFCRYMTEEVGRVGPALEVDEDGVLCRRAPPVGIVKRVVSQSLEPFCIMCTTQELQESEDTEDVQNSKANIL